MSISHWGIFPVPPPLFVVPKGFKVSDQDRAEWNKPGGIIMIERVEPIRSWWPFA